MKVEYVKGDLIQGKQAMIVHGCNAQGVMGAGVALAIKQRLPFAFEAYHMTLKHEGSLRLGQVVWGINIGWRGLPTLRPSDMPKPPLERNRIVGNAITQQHWDPSKAIGGRQVDYDAVRTCFKTINDFARMTQQPESPHNGQDRPIIDIAAIGPITRVGMPRIGAGRGAGFKQGWSKEVWTVIEQIIEQESQNFTPVVYHLD
jgi:O-acetyl-ADP-ribose deacetylase (regulator of RNase III)